MRRLRSAIVRLAALFRRRRLEDELHAEICAHLDLLTEENVRHGMSLSDARNAARRAFGGVDQVKEAYREQRGVPFIETFLQDARFALRSMRKSPGFTALAVLSLALGIGANTAVFSLLDAILLRPLPVRDPQALVELIAAYPDSRQTNLPAEVYEHVRQATDCFTAVVASQGASAALRADARTERVGALFVSGNYFRTLGVGAALGRLLVDEDDRPGVPRVLVLSHRLWSARFAQSADVVGKSVWVDGRAATIVGVAASDFVGLDRSSRPDIVMPLSADRQTESLWIVGRLRPGVSIAQARVRIDPLYRQGIDAAAQRHGGWPERDRKLFLSQHVELLPAANGTVGLRWRLAEPLKVLSGVALLVLLIACTNVAALLLARGESRLGETVVRSALGASRGRIVRAFLLESTLLSVLGGLAGIALAFALHRLLLSLLPLAPSAVVEFRLDHHVLIFTFGVSMIVGVLTGLVPALRATRGELFTILRGAQGRVGGRQSTSSRAVLVLQNAGVLVLLVLAGLFLRSLSNLGDVDAGFDRQHVLVAKINPSESRYAGPRSGLAQDELLQRIRRVPGVAGAGIGANAVFGHGSYVLDVWVEGYRYTADESQTVAFNDVSPGYFATVGLPLPAGREFTAREDRSAPRVAIVNEAFARRYLVGVGRDALGRRLGTMGPSSSMDYEIVGVVADSKTRSLREPAKPAVFFALAQRERSGPFWIHVRTAGDASGWIPAIRSEIMGLDPELEIGSLTTVEERINRSLASERLVATLTMLFAAVALALAGVGLFGTMAHAVTRRTGELGIRMALGADSWHITRLTLNEALLVAALGAAPGLAVAVAGARWFRALLYGVVPSDPATLTAATAMLFVASLLAGLVPARRAARVDPMVALRSE